MSKKKRKLKRVKYIQADISRKIDLKKKIKNNYSFVINLGGYVNHNEKTKTFNSHYLGCKNLADIFLKKKMTILLSPLTEPFLLLISFFKFFLGSKVPNESK